MGSMGLHKGRADNTVTGVNADSEEAAIAATTESDHHDDLGEAP